MDLELPPGVYGSADHAFARTVAVFGRMFGARRGRGGALSVYLRGEPVVKVWAGSANADGSVPWTENTGALTYSAAKGATSTVIHRLADRGLIDYDAPVAEYWREFARNGKSAITIRQLMTHRAGLSGIANVANSFDEILDHRLMEDRLAAAPTDRFLGIPAYHALTYGWLLAGLARSITGLGMADLYRRDVAAPLGVDGIYLGKPPPGAQTTLATAVGTGLHVVGRPLGGRIVSRGSRVPGPTRALARTVYLPGMQAVLEGAEPPILTAECGSSSGVFTADALARMYSAIACGGSTGGRRLLSPEIASALAKVQTYQFDRTVSLPAAWHLGYHSFPAMRARRGFGHQGLGGSGGWVDPTRELAMAVVHNRLSASRLLYDQALMPLLIPSIVRGAGLPMQGRIAQQRPRRVS